MADTISTNAAGPKRVKGDQGEVEQHSLTDQIAADRHVAAKTATKTGGFPFKVQKAVAGGAQ